MSGLKTFAVAGGVGPGQTNYSLGASIAKALVAKGVQVKVLSRDANAASTPSGKELMEAGVKLETVDYNRPTSVEAALEGVDVVVSTLSGGGLPVQSKLIDAAKAVGVKLFVPSEFGNDVAAVDATSPLYVKKAIRIELAEKKVPYLLIITGPFANWINNFLPHANGKTLIVGTGDELISFTATEDICAYLAHVLTNVPLSQLVNRQLNIEGSRKSFNELAAVRKTKAPNLEIEYQSVDEAQKAWSEKFDFMSYLRAAWAEGHGVVSKSSTEIDNGLYPGWIPKSVDTFVSA